MSKAVPMVAALFATVVLAVGVAVSAVSESAEAAFPGENGKITFEYWSMASGSSATDIWTVNSNGSNLKQLTSSPRVMDGSPVWSPDGEKIAFSKDYRIYVINADGSNKIKIAIPEGGAIAVEPTWSADGERIAFRYDCALYVTRADGTGVAKRLRPPNLQGCVARPAWSPDGKQMAFIGGYDPWGNIYVMNVSPEGATSQLRQLTDDPLFDPDYPDWSPDGTEIAFQGDEKIVLGTGSGEDVYKIDVNSLIKTRLTNSPAWEAQPAWSPDGKEIAYVKAVPPGAGEPHSAIYKMNADGSNPTAVFDTGVGGVAENPSWSPLPTPIPPERCSIKGTKGSDVLRGTMGRDVICARGGADAIQGRGGNDVLWGGPGEDVVQGGSGADKLHGEEGVDVLDATDGVRGNDAMKGGGGWDACYGDRGDTKTGCMWG